MLYTRSGNKVALKWARAGSDSLVKSETEQTREGNRGFFESQARSESDRSRRDLRKRETRRREG